MMYKQDKTCNTGRPFSFSMFGQRSKTAHESIQEIDFESFQRRAELPTVMPKPAILAIVEVPSLGDKPRLFLTEIMSLRRTPLTSTAARAGFPSRALEEAGWHIRDVAGKLMISPGSKGNSQNWKPWKYFSRSI